MNDNELEEKILECWQQNASPWIDAIQHNAIASRRLVTNRAITDLILNLHPQTVLDIGCGEGWLTDALSLHGITTVGVDATPSLIDYARKHRLGTYQVLNYDQLSSAGTLTRFDVAVCNFSLLGDQSTELVFQSVGQLLNSHGRFIVQTLHPSACAVANPSVDGWRDGSWDGFSNDFKNPAPWYFRTLASWLAMFARHGFSQPAITEPMHQQSSQPASLILSAHICAR
jgi:2-polyprenyl-3-methyl-5-hydroxy-6-metoxy-1,4-benzoquinol methylase